MERLRFYLNISAEQYLRYYQGIARRVSVQGVDGRRLEFPAEHLRQFVSRDGVQGEFEIRFDAAHRFQGLVRIGDLPRRG